jgi:hypothetical protein
VAFPYVSGDAILGCVSEDPQSKLRAEDLAVVRRFAAWKHRRRTPVQQDSGSPSPQDVYAAFMKTAFAPALRDAGLRGSNGRFELPSETYWAQLGFQKSAYSDGHELRFTVNLSVIRREEWDAQAATKSYLGKRPTPSTLYGNWADQVRIGMLTPGGGDHWWRIVRGMDAEAVRDDALSELLSYGVPWLREHITARGVRVPVDVHGLILPSACKCDPSTGHRRDRSVQRRDSAVRCGCRR